MLLDLKRADKAAQRAPFEPVVHSWEGTYYANQASGLGSSAAAAGNGDKGSWRAVQGALHTCLPPPPSGY